MSSAYSVAPPSARDRRPSVGRCRRLLLAAVLAAAAPGIAWCGQAEGPAAKKPRGGRPVHQIVERGNIESARSVEVRCDVSSQEGSGAAILEVVPEGTVVEPGDLLVKLEASALEEERLRQQIQVANSQAMVEQAEGAYETAALAKQEYTEGLYPLEQLLIQGEIFVAQGELRRAEEHLKALEEQAAEGKVPARELADVRFAAQKAAKQLELSKARLQVLEKFTKARMLTQLDAELKTAESRLRAGQANLQLVEERLVRVQSQIEKCTVRAPVSGIVTYMNVTSSRPGSQRTIIQEGALLRERQPILRLDDLTQLQVRTRIHESRISLVKPGMPAKIRVDAFPDQELTGTVVKVAKHAEPESWLTPDLREYETIIRIDQAPEGLRVGLTAEVKILVEGETGEQAAFPGTSRQLRIDALFQGFDRNKDGRLDREEFPESLRARLKGIDANGDGAVDRDEWRAAQERAARGSAP